MTNALVHRIRIQHTRCIGVDYSVGAELVRIGSGEVVLTAGSIGSAQLLMLSGIGPASHLRTIGVDVVEDLPGVGANLHDHPLAASVVYRPARPMPPSRNNHGEAFGLLASDSAADSPDIQILLLAAQLTASFTVRPEPGCSIAAALMRPRSRGTIRLATADAGTAPVLDPNYYGVDHDLTTMIAGLRLAREISHAPALDPWRGEQMRPGPEAHDDASLRAYLRATLNSYKHPVGTCRIGEDDTAVVDTNLRVHGISHIRVADASVMPSIPTANTNATVYAIAERAAALIDPDRHAAHPRPATNTRSHGPRRR